MHLSLLQFIIIIASVIFFLFWIDLFKRKKATILHLIIFIWGSFLLILFSLNVEALNNFWSFFGIARWADLLVYIALIILWYFYISLFNKNIKDSQELTRLISALAIEKWYEESKDQIKKYKNSDFKDNFVFNIRVYNEASMLESVIDEIIKAWFKKLVFINDGSKDNSQEILENKREENPDCIFVILTHKINRWWWAANQTWYKFIQKYAEQLKVSWIQSHRWCKVLREVMCISSTAITCHSASIPLRRQTTSCPTRPRCTRIISTPVSSIPKRVER